MVTEQEIAAAVNDTAKPVDETLYLVGQPTLREFLRYVRAHALNSPPEATLCDEWHAARNLFRDMQDEQAGIADSPPMTPITSMGPEYEPLVMEFLKDPLVQNGFNTVPTEVAMIELDRLVVYQKHIDLTYVRQLERTIGPSPSPEQIFKLCLPYDHPQPPVKWMRQQRNRWVFVSPSNDLRFLSAMPLQANNIVDYPPPGSMAGVLGLAVGFGSNFMNALLIENRLILNNGSHRAYTLRKMGLTHAPCIVQHVSRIDEVDVVASSEITRHRNHFLKEPRPPMLVDYFNPKLHTVIPVHRRLRQITLKFEVEETFIPAL